jgi:hypothetical protein
MARLDRANQPARVRALNELLHIGQLDGPLLRAMTVFFSQSQFVLTQRREIGIHV